MEDEAFLIDERKEFMVSPSNSGGNPTFRTAHFLNPTFNSINGPNLKLPSLPLSFDSNWPLRTEFKGWRNPTLKWKIWVDKMESLHKSVWKQTGIYDAIMASTFQTRRNDTVLFGIAERWCCETNTFIFPWGEATITLEDMLILGGFSVLGSPVFFPLYTNEMNQLEESLKELAKSRKTFYGRESTWVNYFLENPEKIEFEFEFEHQAFLSLWLSRFVFPGNTFEHIGNHVFSIAIHLSKGTSIALAPAVLASIYRDLSLLKSSMLASVKELQSGSISIANQESITETSYLALTLWAPLRFVQIWAWERIPQLQPNPNSITHGCPRLARWHSLKKSNVENVRWVIDSAGEDFLWRPYALPLKNWLFPSFYKKQHSYVSLNEVLDVDIESFIRCLRVSELVGIDCIEPYLPHRVAMQFGLDQDFPKWIPRSTNTNEIAWDNYNTRICSNAGLYFAPRLFESDVTFRYLEWWRKSVSSPHSSFKDVVKRKRTIKKSKRLASLSKLQNNLDFPPGFPPKCGVDLSKNCSANKCLMNQVEKVIKTEIIECEAGKYGDQGKPLSDLELQIYRPSELQKNLDFPPGFPPKCGVGGGVDLSNTCNASKCLMNQVEKVIKTEIIDCEVGSSINTDISSLKYGEGKPLSNLEPRISRLEELVGTLRAAMLRNK